MGWSLLENSKLRHSNGAHIELVSGTWQRPVEIYPRIPECMSADEQAQLIRQGIVFARRHQASISPKKNA